MLEKPKEYKELASQQNNDTIYAEDINQIISNIELIKGGSSDEAPAGNIKELKADLIAEESARIDADANLQNNIDTEAQARQQKDDEIEANITNEIQNRTAEDDNIKNNIIGDLTILKTIDKNNIVNAINETYNKAGTGGTTDLSNYYNKTQTNNLLKDKVNTTTVGDLSRLNTTDKNNIVNAINETYNKAGGGSSVDILEGQSYDTGKTLNGKKIMKIMWQDIKNNAMNIKLVIGQLEGAGAILDTKVFGNAYCQVIDITAVYLYFPCPYLVNDGQGWGIGIISIGMAGVEQQIISFDSVDETYIKAIEITYLE